MRHLHRGTVAQLRELGTAFNNASRTQINEADEPADYRRFKYAAGRNYENILSVLRPIERQIQVLRETPNAPGYIIFVNAREKLYESLAERDAAGKVMMEQKGEELFYSLSKENHKRAPELEAALKTEHAAGIAAQADISRQVKERIEILERLERDVPLMRVPFGTTPVNLLGGWLSRIRIMLDGRPDEMDEDKEAPLIIQAGPEPAPILLPDSQVPLMTEPETPTPLSIVPDPADDTPSAPPPEDDLNQTHGNVPGRDI